MSKILSESEIANFPSRKAAERYEEIELRIAALNEESELDKTTPQRWREISKEIDKLCAELASIEA
jgi:hypothetical protein